MTAISNNPTAALVDMIGDLKARIAPLEKALKEAQNALKAQGAGRYQGDLFDATVSVSVRETLDMDAVREKLSRQFIQANTKETEVVAVRVTAKLLNIAA